MGTLWRFVKLALSKPHVTLRLLTFRRIRNITAVVLNHPGNSDQLYRRYRDIYQIDYANTIIPRASEHSYCGDIVFFPIIDWNFRTQRPQHLAKALAKAGYRVIYLAHTPLITNPSMRYAIQESPADGVFVVQLSSNSRRLPDLYRDEATESEISGYHESLRALFRDLGVHSPTALVQHPFWFSLASTVSWSKLIYDCIDEHESFFQLEAARLQETEAKLIKSADIVVATSTRLARKIKAIRPCVTIRNGCDYKLFSKSLRKKSSTRSVIGYVGAIAEWFDMSLLVQVAQLAPQWDFVLVGSTAGSGTTIAHDLGNIQFLGEIAYVDVPEMITSFDVCLIPFKISALTLATNPVKLYEYLASGRPVVATPLPELNLPKNCDVYTAASAVDFVEAIRIALISADNPDRIVARKNWAKGHDWSQRGAQFVSCITEDSHSQLPLRICSA